MIQFNLLPDVKKQYVKAKRTKRLIYSASLIVSAGTIGVTAVMWTFVHVAQKKNISDLTKDIETTALQIQNTPDLNTILTVQNQLSTLTGLHETTPETSRVFKYVTDISPLEISVSSLDLDMTSNILRLSGTADRIITINKFVENIKAYRYALQVGDDVGDERPAFTEVQTELSGDNDGASFEVAFSFDPILFDNTEQIVPRLATEAGSADRAGEGQ